MAPTREPRRVLLTGSHGLIGSALARALEADGTEVTRLSRPRDWDPEAGTIDSTVLDGHDAVVHLAGAGVADHRWSAAQRSAIRESRVGGP
ncbi:MAG: NAD-dependent epimerase/dehydratase family protein, partial [Acidimicrobiales bacterium]